MKNVILGTAGHIDHGKTELIKALTGTDTDRLKEEKERGISIDLGFAHLELPDDIRLGIVDVPGHERFVKNMLAGAGGIDAVLLVVAADEGVMPQTREHLYIVDLLGVEQGVVALTKKDLVEDEEWLELVRGDVQSLLAATSLSQAPIVAVSSTSGEGLPALRDELTRVCRRVPGRSSQGPVRLPVDRVFTVEGFGSVVTGTLWSGSVKVGDRLELLPAKETVRVRSVEVHGLNVEEAIAGQRTALALHGVERAEVERGHVLATPDYFRPSHMIDARLRVVGEKTRPLKQRQRVRFHLGSSETLGRLVLLESEQLGPGESALVEFRLEGPVVAQRGDRFVVRSYSPMATIAGGAVVDIAERKRRRFREEDLESLITREAGTGPELALEHLRSAGLAGLTAQELEKRLSLPPEETAALLSIIMEEGKALALGRGKYFHGQAIGELREKITSLLEDHGRRHQLRWGMAKEELRSRLPREMSADVFQQVLEMLAGESRLQLRQDRVRAGGEEMKLPAAAEKAAGEILGRMRVAGMAPPTVGELSKDWPERHAAIELGDLLEALADRGELTKVSPDFYYLSSELTAARERVFARLDEAGEIGVPDFKALFGISRKYAVPLLEFFDREGTTRRVGDRRVRGKRA